MKTRTCYPSQTISNTAPSSPPQQPPFSTLPFFPPSSSPSTTLIYQNHFHNSEQSIRPCLVLLSPLFLQDGVIFLHDAGGDAAEGFVEGGLGWAVVSWDWEQSVECWVTEVLVLVGLTTVAGLMVVVVVVPGVPVVLAMLVGLWVLLDLRVLGTAVLVSPSSSCCCIEPLPWR